MPRIKDSYLDCVIYLYASSSDAEDGLKSGGSGFLLGVPSFRLGHFYIYAVTNRHVIEKGSTVIRVNTDDKTLGVWDTVEPNWIFHPDGDDLAICLLRIKDTSKYSINFVHKSSLLDLETSRRLNIGPGDDTFLVGRFVNHEGRQTNLPTVRFGAIAQMPLEPIRQEHGFMQESFLVETKTVAGYSGSPVFVYIPSMTEREGVEGWYPPDPIWEAEHMNFGMFQSHGPYLLGIEWGYIQDWTPVCDAAGRPNAPVNLQVKVNTGMSAVVPAWKLAEMLEQGPAAEAMKRHSMELEKNGPPPQGATET
jgi:hypothetical protein